MLYPLSYEGGVCAVSCANMALRSRIWPAKASSPPRGLLLGTRRGSQVAAGRVGAARSPCWGRLRAAPVLGGYRDRLRGGEWREGTSPSRSLSLDPPVR